MWNARRVRYRSLIADSKRWDGFELRPGDIIISTPPKCGTTRTQMLCALLIFDGPVFPDTLDQLSPWVDNQTRSVQEVRECYAAQAHRRFLEAMRDRADEVVPSAGLGTWLDTKGFLRSGASGECSLV